MPAENCWMLCDEKQVCHNVIMLLAFLYEVIAVKDNLLKIGPGKIREIANTLKEANITGEILYISGPHVDALYGADVRRQICEVGRIENVVVKSNTISYAMQIAERAIATDISCIVGMGGGRVLDVCKYAAYIAKIPILSIPTTISHDGIASPIAVLKRQDDKPKSLGCIAPTMLIIDTDIISQCPATLIKAGIGDTISNYTALRDWELAVARGKDKMNGYAYIMSKTALETLMKTQFGSICDEFIHVLIHSIVLSGIAIEFAGTSRPVSGSEHLFSHALDFFFNKCNLHGFNVALGTVAVLRIINEDDSEIRNYLHRFGVDVNPRHMEISENEFVYCMSHAIEMRTNRYTYLNEANLNPNHLKKIYRSLVEDL